MRILLTGGAGYIGSHACVELLQAGHDVVVLDDFSNSSRQSIDAVYRITGQRPLVVAGSILNAALLARIFGEHQFDAVIHLAGRKSPAESLEQPQAYLHTNVEGSLTLLRAMQAAQVRNLVFSSSAAVYSPGLPQPIDERAPTIPATPYGYSKLMVEQALASLHAASQGWRVAVLRCFNPVGAHPSGELGEDLRNPPTNLLPACMSALRSGDRVVPVFGCDYPTVDGTGVRDYVHVMDLAAGLIAALRYVTGGATDIHRVINIGAGRGTSVAEMLTAIEAASGTPLLRRNLPRRAGDDAVSIADVRLARELLGWSASQGIGDICRDAVRWSRQARQFPPEAASLPVFTP